MTSKPRANDEDDDCEYDPDPTVELIEAAHHQPVDSEGSLAEMILDLHCAMTKLRVLLEEAPEAEFRVVARRLEGLRATVAALPTKPQPQRKIGFGAPLKGAEKPANIRQGKSKR